MGTPARNPPIGISADKTIIAGPFDDT